MKKFEIPVVLIVAVLVVGAIAFKIWDAGVVAKDYLVKQILKVVYKVGFTFSTLLIAFDKLTHRVNCKAFRNLMNQTLAKAYDEAIRTQRVQYHNVGTRDTIKTMPPRFMDTILDENAKLRNIIKIVVLFDHTDITEYYEVDGGEYVILAYSEWDYEKGNAPYMRHTHTLVELIQRSAKADHFPHNVQDFVYVMKLTPEY